MRELLDFFVKNSKWFVFILLVAVSCVLLSTGSPYQRHVYLSSANAVTATVYRLSDNVYSYFSLRKINDGLNERNAALESQVIQLRQQIDAMRDQQLADTIAASPECQYEFIVAHVINNSISRPNNYITINKGSADGIRPEMGVIDQNGVVGSVNVVGEHASRVISVLNPNFHVSCKIKGTEHFGTLTWDGRDSRVALLEDMPRHSHIKAGDTIVTTGFSAVFPPNIEVGRVLPPPDGEELDINHLRIRLSTDFSTLSTVQVVVNSLAGEMMDLEATDPQK